ncbi:MAG: TetR family transcriptional regulator [Fimbriimonadales bacterium]|nr:MAG: TetR family transcriptional regulator [Fimbriimonadales bacterium]GIV07986.1 MAG: TetR family transcriptional regulator [Fimbriimonadales bacterium]
MAKRTERQEARREQILNGAARVFSQKGYHASTVDEIAKELGLTKASIYYYVSDKSDLLYQLYKRAMTALLESQQEILERPDPPNLKLRAMIEEYVRIVTSATAVYSVVVLREHQALPPRKRKEIIALRDQYEQNYQQCIQEGIEQGIFDAQDVKMASYVVLGALNWIPNWFNPRGSLSKEQIGCMFAEQLVRGLMARRVEDAETST